jgi:hypothetical protein
MTVAKDRKKEALKVLYEEKLKSFILTDPATGEQIPVPVCFGARENNVRKPARSVEEIEENIRKVTTCSKCDFLNSCSSGTEIDTQDQMLMFLRMINAKFDTIINLMRISMAKPVEPLRTSK